MAHPRTIQEIVDNFNRRKDSLRKALTEDVDAFYQECHPEKDNLCLYGHSNGTWQVDLPAEEVPAELPEPCLGINFARDGMAKKDWLALVAVHSDAWLLSVAFYYGAKLNAEQRMQLFGHINSTPTLFEMVTGKARHAASQKRSREMHIAVRIVLDCMAHQLQARGPSYIWCTREVALLSEVAAKLTSLPLGKLRTYSKMSMCLQNRTLLRHHEVGPGLKGRRAELYWPDDGSWYGVTINAINVKKRIATVQRTPFRSLLERFFQIGIQYDTGEIEELDLSEIITDEQMYLLD